MVALSMNKCGINVAKVAEDVIRQSNKGEEEEENGTRRRRKTSERCTIKFQV